MFLGIFICIGPIIDEVQVYEYMNNRECAKARQLLLITWLFVGFTLTLSYKEVLIANLVNVGYEDPIDNFEDLVSSGRKMVTCENCYIPYLLYNDHRESVKQLLKDDKIVWVNFTGQYPLPLKKR